MEGDGLVMRSPTPPSESSSEPSAAAPMCKLTRPSGDSTFGESTEARAAIRWPAFRWLNVHAVGVPLYTTHSPMGTAAWHHRGYL